MKIRQSTEHLRRIGFSRMLAGLLGGVLLTLTTQAASIALVGERLIDGKSDTASADTVVVIEGQRITAVGGRDLIPGDATVVKLDGMTLMPGMINAHDHPLMYAHDYQNAHLQSSSAYKALMGLATLQRWLLAGWTTVRVVGDADVYYGNQDLARVIEDGVFTGPRITGAAHYISTTAGGGDINFFSPEQQVNPDGLVADGAEAMRKAVRLESKYGSDWIKIMVTGSYMGVGDSPMRVLFSPEELAAVVDEAGRLGLPVAAHAHAAAGVRQAVEAGVRSIEHGTFVDAATMALMASKGTFLVPTIYVGDYYGEGDKLLAQDKNTDYFLNERSNFLARVGQAYEAGVRIAVGVDLGGYAVDPTVYAREFAVLVEAGLSPMDAIRAGTSVAAELLQWDKRLGSLEPGMLADMIVLSDDLLTIDPEQILDVLIETTIVGGRVVFER